MLYFFFSFIISYEVNVDLGSFYSKASYYIYSESPQMCVNLQSKRLTPTFLGFKVPKKLSSSLNQTLSSKQLKKLHAVFGDDALTYSQSRPQFVTGYFPLFSDRNEEMSQNISTSLLTNYEILHIKNHDLLSFYMKLFLDCITGGRPTKYVHLVYPASFTIPQRHYIEEAVKLAGYTNGYSCDDVEAIISLYSVTRSQNLQNNGLSKNVLFIDVGATSTKAYVVSFKINSKQQVLAERFPYKIDEQCGGSYLSIKMAETFMERYQIENPTIQEKKRFVDCAEKIKKQLTLINFTYCLIEDIRGQNINITFTRQEFDEINQEFRNKVVHLAKEASNGLSIDDIEMIGGSHRIPSLQTQIQEEFHINISHTLNADDALAIGCGFAAQFHGEFSNFIAPLIISERGQYSLSMRTSNGYEPVCIKDKQCRAKMTFNMEAKLFIFQYKEEELSKGLKTLEFSHLLDYPDAVNITVDLSITPFYVTRGTYCSEDKCMPTLIQQYTPPHFNHSVVVDALITGEKNRLQQAKSHNDLEQLTIKCINYLKNETIQIFTNEEQRQEILNLSEDSQKWLFNNPYAPQKQVKDRIKNLRHMIEIIDKRVRENTTQFHAMESYMSTMSLIEHGLETWKDTKPWIPQETKDKLNETLSQYREWLDNEINEIQNSPLWKDRRITAHDIDKKGKKLYQEYLNVASIKPAQQESQNKQQISQPEDYKEPSESNTNDKEL